MIIVQPQEDSAMNNDKVEKSPSMVIKYLVFSYCAHQGAKYTKKKLSTNIWLFLIRQMKSKKKKKLPKKSDFLSFVKELKHL